MAALLAHPSLPPAAVLQVHRGLTQVAALLAAALTRTALLLVCLAAWHLRLHHRIFVIITRRLVLMPATANSPVPGWHSRTASCNSRLSSLAVSSSFCRTPSLLKTSWWTLVPLQPLASSVASSTLWTPPPPHCRWLPSPHLGNPRNFGLFRFSPFPFFFSFGPCLSSYPRC